jgi:hypothetical protein
LLILAVNVTEVFEQILLADELILMLGVTLFETVINNEFELTVAGLAQLAFELRSKLIISLLTKLEAT